MNKTLPLKGVLGTDKFGDLNIEMKKKE